MFKLLRRSSVVLRLRELKHSTNCNVFNRTSLSIVNESNLLITNVNPCIKYYATEQQNETNQENGLKSENSDSNTKDLIDENLDLDKKMKIIALETEVLRQQGCNVPSESFLKKQHWEELLKLQSRTARRKYLTFLFKLEKKKENFQMKKEKKRSEREEHKPPLQAENGHLIYNLSNNNIFLRFYDTKINHLYNNKLIEAIMFGQKLVVDCGYDEDMTKRENVNCAKQLTLLFSENRYHDDPFDLHLCNMAKDKVLGNSLQTQITTLYEPWFPLNVYEKSYLNLFPKDKLIYLTPDCKEEMLEYDHDAVYIIGAIVDKSQHQPLSLAKAKKEGLKMLKLPLDRYLSWGSGSGKSLTLNQMISVLLDIKKTGDWNYALRHVPKRKIVRDFNLNTRNSNQSQSYERKFIPKKTRPRNFDMEFERNSPSSRNRFHVKTIMND